MVAYMAIGLGAFLIHPEYIQDLGMFFGMTSIPLIGYFVGETFRPSGTLLNMNKRNEVK